jgi:hypothetical protein
MNKAGITADECMMQCKRGTRRCCRGTCASLLGGLGGFCSRLGERYAQPNSNTEEDTAAPGLRGVYPARRRRPSEAAAAAGPGGVGAQNPFLGRQAAPPPPPPVPQAAPQPGFGPRPAPYSPDPFGPGGIYYRGVPSAARAAAQAAEPAFGVGAGAEGVRFRGAQERAATAAAAAAANERARQAARGQREYVGPRPSAPRSAAAAAQAAREEEGLRAAARAADEAARAGLRGQRFNAFGNPVGPKAAPAPEPGVGPGWDGYRAEQGERFNFRGVRRGARAPTEEERRQAEIQEEIRQRKEAEAAAAAARAEAARVEREEREATEAARKRAENQARRALRSDPRIKKPDEGCIQYLRRIDIFDRKDYRRRLMSLHPDKLTEASEQERAVGQEIFKSISACEGFISEKLGDKWNLREVNKAVWGKWERNYGGGTRKGTRKSHTKGRKGTRRH